MHNARILLTAGCGIAFACWHPPLAAAQDFLSADKQAIEVCIGEKADHPSECIGIISTPCQDDPGGSTTIGIAECLGREEAAWDAILNEVYGRRMADARQMDERLEADGIYLGGVVDSLRNAQRAWISFRDAECERIFNVLQEGTIRTTAAASCLLEMTAERVLDLDAPGL